MTIYSVFDPEFKPYGKVVPGCDTAELCRTLEAVTPLPANRCRLGVLVDRCVGNHRESLRLGFAEPPPFDKGGFLVRRVVAPYKQRFPVGRDLCVPAETSRFAPFSMSF